MSGDSQWTLLLQYFVGPCPELWLIGNLTIVANSTKSVKMDYSMLKYRRNFPLPKRYVVIINVK